MAVSFPFAPAGTFVETDRIHLVASFPQNVLKNVEAGDPVEMSFKSRPGMVYSGTVESIVQATGEGQFVTTGQLGSAIDIGSSGAFAVKFNLDDEEVGKGLALGTAGTVVIYTKTGQPFQIISKVVVRMNAWMYYFVPF